MSDRAAICHYWESFKSITKSGFKLKNQKRQKIIGFRNKLVHAYDSIDNSIVWVILRPI